MAKQTLSRELSRMGYRKLSARPRYHAQAEGAIEASKKACPRAWARLGAKRVFTSYDNLLDHCCAAWNELTNQPWTIMSLGLRDWAHRF